MQSFLSGGVKKQVWLGALLYLALSGSAFAQSTGTINGRVTDATDAVVAGATVTVTSTTTAVARNAVTNGEGLYSIPALHPGVYDVKAEMTGFAPSVKKGVTLITDTTLALDFSLAVAGTTQQVEVSGETVLVETTQSEVSGSLRTSEVQNLPMLNRNFTGLVTLVPGARPAAIYNPTKQAMGAAMSIGGGIGRNVEVNVDGGDNRDDIIGGPMQNYTIEGIQEFKLLSHEFGAQYGRTSGGVLQIATKSGTNSLHGTAFGYGRNDAMTAIDYFTKNSATPVKTPYSREQFGGSLGGPINKDRLFFFGAFERVQENYIQTELATSYAEAQALATVFPSIVVPALFIPEPFRDNMYTLKSDFQINSHHSVFVRWAQQINWKDNDSTSTTHADLTRTQTDRNHLWSIVASETWLIGSNSVNQFMIQRNDYDDYLKNNGPVVKGVPGYTPVTQNLSFPNLAIGRAQGADQEFIQKKWQFQDNFSHQMGKHALKFGGDFSFYPHISVIAGYLGCGSISFFDKPSVIINNTNGKYPKGFLTPGIVASISQNTCSVGGPLEDPGLVGAKQVGAYVADDWKVTPRLTWNLGLRYDVDINFFNQNLLPRSVNYQALQAIGSRYATPPHNGTYDFGPRVGFAWDIGGNARNVLRASFGIFFDENMEGNAWTQTLLIPLPSLTITSSLVNTSVGAGQLATYVYGVSPLPPGPAPITTKLPPRGNTGGAVFEPNIANPYNEQFHVGYTRRISASTALSADYTHVLGLREFRGKALNPLENTAWDPNAASYNACGVPAGISYRRLQCQFARALEQNPGLLGLAAGDPLITGNYVDGT